MLRESERILITMSVNNVNDNKRKYDLRLYFDKNRDPYMIDALDKLSKSNRLSDFIRFLLMQAIEDPSGIKSMDTDEFIRNYRDFAVTPCAKKFYAFTRQEVKSVHDKIDAIYNMCLDMYTRLQFTGVVAPEKQIDGIMMAEYMGERMLERICDVLGIPDMKPFESSCISDIKSTATRNLDYIINSYPQIVEEIRDAASDAARGASQGVPHGVDGMDCMDGLHGSVPHSNNDVVTAINDTQKTLASLAESVNALVKKDASTQNNSEFVSIMNELVGAIRDIKITAVPVAQQTSDANQDSIEVISDFEDDIDEPVPVDMQTLNGLLGDDF